MKLLVVDGNSILNRAFYGIKLLSTKDGQFTNAIYGFLTTLNRITEEVKPDAYAIAFDLKKPTFRHIKYSEYKANRKGMPFELAQQMPVIKELLVHLGYKIVECEGFEADDILGTLAKACQNTQNHCVIATGDKDSLQLVDDNVTVNLISTKMGKPTTTIYDENKVKEDFLVTPKQLIEIKAIQGDTSDNITGVKGIGPKGATSLIVSFENLDGVYQNIDSSEIKKGTREKLIADKENAYLSRFLGEIVTNAPVDLEIESYIKKDGDYNKAFELMTKLEFFSLRDKMLSQSENTFVPTVEKENVDAILCDNFDELLKELKEVKKAIFLPRYKDGYINSLAFYINSKVKYVDNSNLFFNSFLKEFFESSEIEKQTHDLKLLYHTLDKVKIDINNATFDTLLSAYLLNPNSSNYEISRLSDEYNANIYNVIIENEECDHIKNVANLSKLIENLQSEIKENNQENLLFNIEIPLAKVLAKTENVGFMVDCDGIKEYGKTLQIKLNELQNKVYDEVGYVFNINSPKQLGVALFENLKLPTGKKNKSGYSTSATVLEDLQNDYPIVKDILEFRTISKLISTYCDGLLKVVAEDGRIHTTFNQTETRTGRISSTEPNLQNIPVRTKMGRELRKFFTAKDGCMLVGADYSQIELRVLSHIAHDEVMKNAFINEEDIHTITAAQVFNMPIDMVAPEMRSRAKAVNFGIVYGIGAFSLAKDIGVTRKEAQNYIDAYLEHYSGVSMYMERVVKKATIDGFVKTIFERKRYLPELSSSNFNMRSFGQRVAMNMPIQGSAADIIKIAMIKVYNRLEKENLKAKLILQVHDELIVEAPDNEVMQVAQILQEEMENAVKLDVPLTADACMGKTWYDTKN